MRYQTGHAEVLAEGFAQTASFTIAASGKAFKGLIDGLYSRKIEAAIRELATNAFDAHMAAASIAPFEVHLPTVFQPTFWIRDFGTGMSHDLITRRYTTMFDSTKDGLNAADASLVSPDNQVGCLGLGSKAFFAYTDACTITTWQDGEARMYSVFMGADGVPQIALAGQMPSDEPVGVKVEFAVKKRDYEAFSTAAVRVFKGFPNQPTGLPSDVREALAVAPKEIGSFWKSYPKDFLPDGGFYARQGCVLYPIDLIQIDENRIEEDDEDYDADDDAPKVVSLSAKYARFKALEATIVMDFPIGSVEFDLSRERLAYTEHTLRSIRTRWDEFVADLDAVIADQFADRRTGWERAVTANNETCKTLGPLFSQNSYFLESDTLSETLKDMFPEQRANRTTKHAFFSAIKRTDGHNSTQPIYQTRYSMFPGKPNPADVVLFYRDPDAGRQINARINQHLNTLGVQWGFLFDKGRLTADVWKRLGRPPIVRVSEIDELPKEVRIKDGTTGLGGGGVFDRVKVIDGNGYRALEEGEDVEDHLWAFMHRGMHIELVEDGKFYAGSDLAISNVIVINSLSQALGGPTISFINCRSNDKEGRWSDLPTFYNHYDKLAERFPKELLGRFVKLWNWSQFSHTNYATVYGSLTDSEKKVRDDLTRLHDRYNYSPNKDRQPLDGELMVVVTEAAFAKLRNDLLRIAADAGMDVLQPSDCHQKLLSTRWERAVKYLQTMRGHTSGDGQSARIFARHLIRKDAQC